MASDVPVDLTGTGAVCARRRHRDHAVIGAEIVTGEVRQLNQDGARLRLRNDRDPASRQTDTIERAKTRRKQASHFPSMRSCSIWQPPDEPPASEVRRRILNS